MWEKHGRLYAKPVESESILHNRACNAPVKSFESVFRSTDLPLKKLAGFKVTFSAHLGA